MSQPPGLLAQLLDSEVDPEYRTAAAAHDTEGRARSGWSSVRIFAAVAVFGVLLSVSAVKTERDRPQALVERTNLIAAIHGRQDKLERVHATLRRLQSRVAELQTGLAAMSDAEARLRNLTSTLGIASGMSPVRGPGLVITADNAPDPVPGAGGIILDSDLQALVNGLWVAGAEAIAINGHRLTTLTAIRFAGQAITVDYRSLSPPYVVAAIGDPDTLPARFSETQGGQAWQGLRANFGIRFETKSTSQIELPGDSHDIVNWARRTGTR